MSRDFKPFELFLVDRNQNNQIRENNVVFFDNITGKEHRIEHPARERYPELSFLCSGFDDLYKKHKKDNEVLETFDTIEETIKKVEKDFMMGYKDTPESPVEETVSLWFKGKLDPNFYYSETNTEMFLDFLEAMTNKEKAKVFLNNIEVATDKLLNLFENALETTPNREKVTAIEIG